MARSRETATTPTDQDAVSLPLPPGQPIPPVTSGADLPPEVLLNRYRVRALELSHDTLPLDQSRNGDAVEDTASPVFRDGQRNGRIGNGASQNGLNAVRQAVPAVSPRHSRSFYPKQEWEGRVTAIHKDEFDARLRDLTGGGRHVATIELEEIGPEDRERLFVGSMFHWVMGYERAPGGTRSYVSRIVFLDPPRLTKRDLERGQRWADRLRAKWNLD